MLEALTVFDLLPDIARFPNCLKRNFGVNQNLNYATLLKIMVEYRTMLIVHKLSLTRYTLLAIHDTSHFSKGNAAVCHGANIIQTT